MHELVDVGQLGIIFPNTPLSTTKTFIKSNRDTTLRFLRGFTQGLNRLRTDKEFSMKVLSKYTKVTDTETLAQLHQTYGVRYSGDRIPYVRAEGVDEILKRTPGKEAREAKADEFIDNSLLKGLEQSGWFRTAGTLRPCALSSLEGRVGLGSSSCASFLRTAIKSRRSTRPNRENVLVRPIRLTWVKHIRSKMFSKTWTLSFILPANAFRTPKPDSTRSRSAGSFPTLSAMPNGSILMWP